MGCFRPSRPKTISHSKPSSSSGAAALSSHQQNPEPKTLKQVALLQIPGCVVHLIEEGEAVELARGEFVLIRILDDDVSLATIVKVGEDLQWPLTKDEPVVKLDSLDYLFSLPVKDGDPLSYGVSFSKPNDGSMIGLLDSLLKEHSCFSGLSSNTSNTDIDWKEFAPRIEDYNGVLAKAIAGGTGQIVKGIFKCSNAYTNQVQKGGEMILSRAAEKKNGFASTKSKSNRNPGATKKSGVNKNLKRVRKLSKMTEKISKTMLDGAGIAGGSVVGPLVRSQAGKAFFNMAPGKVLLASLDAVNMVLDAAEAAEKQAFSATSGAATRMVSERFGESAGEATGDVLATAGHCFGTAWNIFKIRKAINPASSVTSELRKAAKNRKA